MKETCVTMLFITHKRAVPRKEQIFNIDMLIKVYARHMAQLSRVLQPLFPEGMFRRMFYPVNSTAQFN